MQELGVISYMRHRPRKVKTGLDAEKYSMRISWHRSERHYVAWIPELSEWGVACGGDSVEQAIERLRSRFISTLDLIPDEEYEQGLARAEAELPDTIRYNHEWLIAVAS